MIQRFSQQSEISDHHNFFVETSWITFERSIQREEEFRRSRSIDANKNINISNVLNMLMLNVNVSEK